MKRSSREVQKKEFHPHADQLVQEYVDKFCGPTSRAGAFLQGLVTELTAGRQSPIAVYTAMGFLGVILIFAGLRR